MALALTIFFASASSFADYNNIRYVRLEYLQGKDTICVSSKLNVDTNPDRKAVQKSLVEIVREVFETLPEIKIKSEKDCHSDGDISPSFTDLNVVKLSFLISGRMDKDSRGKDVLAAAMSMNIIGNFARVPGGEIESYVERGTLNTHPFILDGGVQEQQERIKTAATIFVGHLPSYFQCVKLGVDTSSCNLWAPYNKGVRHKIAASVPDDYTIQNVMHRSSFKECLGVIDYWQKGGSGATLDKSKKNKISSTCMLNSGHQLIQVCEKTKFGITYTRALSNNAVPP